MILGPALRTEHPSSLWVSRTDGLSLRCPGDEVGSVHSGVGEFSVMWGSCFHTLRGVERTSSWSQPCHWPEKGQRLRCHRPHLQNGFAALGSRGDPSCFRLPRKLGPLSLQSGLAQQRLTLGSGLGVELQLVFEKFLCGTGHGKLRHPPG